MRIKKRAKQECVKGVVRNVGGEDVDVVQVMGSGVDPHLYKATRDDVRLIMTADIVFYSGLMLEGKTIDTLEKLGQNLPFVAVTEGIEEIIYWNRKSSRGTMTLTCGWTFPLGVNVSTSLQRDWQS